MTDTTARPPPSRTRSNSTRRSRRRSAGRARRGSGSWPAPRSCSSSAPLPRWGHRRRRRPAPTRPLRRHPARRPHRTPAPRPGRPSPRRTGTASATSAPAFGGFGRFGFRDITITAINGSDLSLRTDDGWTRTITVTSTTTITKGGATITVGDLAVGDQIAFAQDRADDGTYTVTAIKVVLPTTVGEVTAIDGDTITVTQPGGTTATIHVDGDTTYQVNGAAGALSDIKVGSIIAAEGTQRSDGSLDAAAVRAGDRGIRGPGLPGRSASARRIRMPAPLRRAAPADRPSRHHTRGAASLGGPRRFRFSRRSQRRGA